jgi:hypothetical protein
MPKFEYALLTVHVGGLLTDTNCDFTIFHVDRKNESNSGTFGHIVGLAGEQGWELVAGSSRAVPGITGGFKVDYIFKREKEQANA